MVNGMRINWKNFAVIAILLMASGCATKEEMYSYQISPLGGCTFSISAFDNQTVNYKLNSQSPFTFFLADENTMEVTPMPNSTLLKVRGIDAIANTSLYSNTSVLDSGTYFIYIFDNDANVTIATNHKMECD